MRITYDDNCFFKNRYSFFASVVQDIAEFNGSVSLVSFDGLNHT